MAATDIFWDDNERGSYIAHKKTYNNEEPDMQKVLKEIVLLTRYKGIDLQQDEDYDDNNYITPEMYYEYPELNEIDLYPEMDDEGVEALEEEALDEYFEQCYESLCKNKFADA